MARLRVWIVACLGVGLVGILLFSPITNAVQPFVAAAGEAAMVSRATQTPTVAVRIPVTAPTRLGTPTATSTTGPTPTFTPTPLPRLRPTPVRIRTLPTVNPSSTLTIPTAVPLQPIPEDAITILLLGSDQRPDWNDWHTDVIQYVVVYPDVPAVNILSIPRDLYVYVPGFWMSRVNFADMYGEVYDYDGGGLGLLNQTLMYNLGISADYYVKVNFDGLISLVDMMGGIDVPVYCRLEDYWPYPNEQGEYDWFALAPGIHHLDGEQALWYSRSRKTTSVFSRERRQQQVLEAMWRRAKDLNLMEKAPEMYRRTRHLFQTDLGMGNILSLAMTAKDITSADIRRYNIGARQVTPYVTENGGNVFLPVWPAIRPTINDVLTPPASSRAIQQGIRVEVWNGTRNRDWDRLAADTLAHNGFIPVIGRADRRDYPRTQIVYFSQVTKGSGIARLQTLFNVDADRLIQEEEGDPEVKIRLIIGEDYQPCTQR